MENGRIKTVGNKVYLKAEGWDKEKLLGVKTETGVSIKKSRDKHLLRMDQSYGINKELLKAMEETANITLSDEHGVYQLPVATILSEGRERDFSKTGSEPQLFVPLTTWENNKVS